MIISSDPVTDKLKKLENSLNFYEEKLNKGIVLNFFQFSEHFMLLDDMAKFIKKIINRKNNNVDFSVEETAFLLMYSCTLYLYNEAPLNEQNAFMLSHLVESSSNANNVGNYESDLDLLFNYLKKKNPTHSALRYYASYKALASAHETKYIIRVCKYKLAPLFSVDEDIFSYMKGIEDIPNVVETFISNTTSSEKLPIEYSNAEEHILLYFFEKSSHQKMMKAPNQTIKNARLSLKLSLTSRHYKTMTKRSVVIISTIIIARL